MKKLFFLLSLGCLVFGCLEIWNLVWHRTPVEVTLKLSTFTELPKHVTLKDVYLSSRDLVSTGKKASCLYIPIRSRHDTITSSKLHFLLKTKDEALLAAYRKAETLDDPDQLLITLKPLREKSEVSGMLDGTGVSSKERKKLLELLPGLAPDFTVLEEGRHPSFFMAISLLMVSGVAMFILSKLAGPSEPTPAPPVLADLPPVISEQKK